jgi:hypothetical protein
MVLFAEPAGHVKPEEFDSELRMAVDAGLAVTGRPSIRPSQAVWLRKP